MKYKFFAPILLTLILFISACKKDSTTAPTPTYPIEGLWTGTYKVDAQPTLPDQYFSFIIKSGGTLIVETKGGSTQYILVGTWTLTGNTLNCNYTNIWGSAPPTFVGATQIATATFSNSGKLTTGIWTNTSASGSGTFTLNRVN